MRRAASAKCGHHEQGADGFIRARVDLAIPPMVLRLSGKKR
jgi:hypothetical protein